MIVVSADLHLSRTIWATLPELQGDAYSALRQIVDYSIEHDAEAMLFAGDVFNAKNPDSQSVKVFKDQMARTDILKIVTEGQHDRSTPPWASLSDHVRHVGDSEVQLTIDGHPYKLYAYNNAPADQVKTLMDKLPKDCDILMMHQALRQVISYEGAWNLDAEWIPDFVQLVLLGDLHVEASVDRCHYPGSTHLRSMSESPDKSFITVHSDGKKLTVKRHPLETRMTKMVTINDESSLDATISMVNTLPSKQDLPLRPVVLARVAPDVSDAYRRLGAVCKERDIFLRIRDINIKFNTEEKEDAQVPVAASLEKCIELAVDRTEKPELYALLAELLTSPDPGNVLSVIKEKMGITG